MRWLSADSRLADEIRSRGGRPRGTNPKTCSRRLRRQIQIVPQAAAGGPKGPSDGGKGSGGGGGGGGGGSGKGDDNNNSGPALGPLGALWKGWEDRVAYDAEVWAARTALHGRARSLAWDQIPGRMQTHAEPLTPPPPFPPSPPLFFICLPCCLACAQFPFKLFVEQVRACQSGCLSHSSGSALRSRPFLRI
jgi:hypothetical protein